VCAAYRFERDIPGAPVVDLPSLRRTVLSVSARVGSVFAANAVKRWCLQHRRPMLNSVSNQRERIESKPETKDHFPAFRSRWTGSPAAATPDLPRELLIIVCIAPTNGRTASGRAANRPQYSITRMRGHRPVP